MSKELVDALMVARGSCLKSLGRKAVHTNGEMYTATPSVEMMANAVEAVPKTQPTSVAVEQENILPVVIRASGDEAVGSPVISVIMVPVCKCTFSSLDDDSFMMRPHVVRKTNHYLTSQC
jgi:hypothetical protein